jgi:hypothetical protein
MRVVNGIFRKLRPGQAMNTCGPSTTPIAGASGLKTLIGS